jgi:hypothetical protein
MPRGVRARAPAVMCWHGKPLRSKLAWKAIALHGDASKVKERFLLFFFSSSRLNLEAAPQRRAKLN